MFRQDPKTTPGPVTTVILDCDGVILESVSVKTDAFAELFSFAAGKKEEIIAYHLNNGGMSRYDKFRYIYSDILKQPLTESRFEELSHNFASLVHQNVVRSPFVVGAEEFLESYHNRLALHVVSATPEGELLEIFEERNLLRYFRSVHGAPEKKAVHLRNIASRSSCDPSTFIFVGDARNDYSAAKEAGIRFIARIKEDEPDRFMGLAGIEYRINNLQDLDRYIRDVTC